MFSISTIMSDFWEYRGNNSWNNKIHATDNGYSCPLIDTGGITSWFKCYLRSLYIDPYKSIRLSDKRFSRTFDRFRRTTTGSRHRNPLYRAGLLFLFVSLIFSSRTVPLDMCQVQFLSTNKEATNQVVTVVTSLAAFYLPVTLMAILYFKIFLETRQRHKELRKLQASGW